MATANTLRETRVFEGVGLHTGEPCKVMLHPLTPTEAHPTNILLRKGNHAFPARWNYVVDTTRATVLGDGDVKISTVEHLMAALWMTGITHCMIEVLQGNEIPILDGSALPFVEAIRSTDNPVRAEPQPCSTDSPVRAESLGLDRTVQATEEADKVTPPQFHADMQPNLTPLSPLSARGEGGTDAAPARGSPSPFTERGVGGEVKLKQETPNALPEVEARDYTAVRSAMGLDRAVQATEGDRYLALALAGDTLFGYIQFPEPLGVQAGAFPIDDVLTQIAPARTFGFLREVEALRRQGLALGGALDNALVIGETGYHNPARFEDEPLRHKLLDALGDLYLSGVYLRQFTLVAVKPGHALNVQLARRLAQALNAEDNLWRSSD